MRFAGSAQCLPTVPEEPTVSVVVADDGQRRTWHSMLARWYTPDEQSLESTRGLLVKASYPLPPPPLDEIASEEEEEEEEVGGERWEVCAKKALIREGVELDSERVLEVSRGREVIAAVPTTSALSSCGTVRLLLSSPRGWVSWKCARPKHWEEDLAATGRARWVLDLASWRPILGECGEEWAMLLGLVPQRSERDKVVAYARWIDRARALASRLLAAKCCAVALGIDHDDVEIQRTKGGKPYVAKRSRLLMKKPPPTTTLTTKSSDDTSSPSRSEDSSPKKKKKKAQPRPNFNFNLSHDGRYVVLASEPRCVVGVDVAAPESLRRAANLQHQKQLKGSNQKANSYQDLLALDQASRTSSKDDDWWLRVADTTLTDRERRWVDDDLLEKKAPWANQSRAERFRIVWSCKEALTKARGDGIACNFKNIHLDIRHVNDDDNDQKHFKESLDDDDDEDDYSHPTNLGPEEESESPKKKQSVHAFSSATVSIDGHALAQWTVAGRVLDSGHVVAVARGPPSAVVDAWGGFAATLEEQRLDDDEFKEPHPSIVFLDFADLVPKRHLDAFHAARVEDRNKLEKTRRQMKRVSVSDTHLLSQETQNNIGLQTAGHTNNNKKKVSFSPDAPRQRKKKTDDDDDDDKYQVGIDLTDDLDDAASWAGPLQNFVRHVVAGVDDDRGDDAQIIITAAKEEKIQGTQNCAPPHFLRSRSAPVSLNKAPASPHHHKGPTSASLRDESLLKGRETSII